MWEQDAAQIDTSVFQQIRINPSNNVISNKWNFGTCHMKFYRLTRNPVWIDV